MRYLASAGGCTTNRRSRPDRSLTCRGASGTFRYPLGASRSVAATFPLFIHAAAVPFPSLPSPATACCLIPPSLRTAPPTLDTPGLAGILKHGEGPGRGFAAIGPQLRSSRGLPLLPLPAPFGLPFTPLRQVAARRSIAVASGGARPRPGVEEAPNPRASHPSPGNWTRPTTSTASLSNLLVSNFRCFAAHSTKELGFRGVLGCPTGPRVEVTG
jgi:hypothetical protein